MNYQSISNGKLTILMQDGYIKKIKDIANAKAQDIMSKTEDGYNCDSIAYLTAIDRLCDLARTIIGEYPKLDIFSFLPLTKSKDFPKRQSILLADTGIRNTLNQDYFSQKRLQLRLTPVYASESDWLHDNPMHNALQIEIEEFGSDSRTPAVFDENNVPNAVLKTRNSYLKDKQIRPGCIYKDSKGTEYLYLGFYSMPIRFENKSNEARALAEANNDRIEYEYQIPKHFYVRATGKLRTTAGRYATLQDFLDAILLQNAAGSMSSRENPRKFVEETGCLFADTDVTDHILQGMEPDDARSYRMTARIRPMDPDMKYLICAD